MSVLDFLKSLFKKPNNKENENKVKVEPSEENKKDSSEANKLDDIVSGTKTSEPINATPSTSSVDDSKNEDAPSKETKDKGSEEKTDSAKELETKKEETSEEDKSEEKVKPVEEESSQKEESVEVEEPETEVSEDEVEEQESNKNKDKKSDNMTLLKDNEVFSDKNIDKDFTNTFLEDGIESVKNCFQCGTCGGSCPSGRKTPYRVRQIIRKCLLGLKEEVITDDALWMCTTCYTCQERCPRSIKIVEIIKKARNIAAHAGYMAKPHKMTGVFVMNTGHAVPIKDAIIDLREKVGLEAVPPTTHKYPEALKEVQNICKATGFDALIGYDEATGGLKE